MLSFLYATRANKCLRLSFFSFSMAVVALLLREPVAAQMTLTGTAASTNFGSQPVGSASASRALSFSVAAGTSVGSVAVLTTGVAKLDFANVTGTTCTAQLYSMASTCVVDVTFTPLAAGLRLGAVVFFSKANNAGVILGSTAIYGVGAGAQIVMGAGTVSAVDRTMHGVVGLSDPQSLTLDAAGNLFILDAMSDPTSYRMVKVPAGGGTPTAVDPSVNGEPLYLPSCVAIDGAGNVYIGDFERRVVEVPAGGGAATAIAPVVNNIALDYPSGLAVDGSGDLFIADFINNRVLEVPAGGGAAIAIDPTVNGYSLSDPHGLAVDGAGDLFIADLGNDRIVKVPVSGAVTVISPIANNIGLRNPEDVAVDAAGDLFVADNINHRVVEAQAGGTTALAIDPTMYEAGVGEVYAVKVDGAGNLFLVQGGLASGSNLVEEVEQSQTLALSFATPTAIGSVDVADGVQSVQLTNIGNLAVTLTTIKFPADFIEASGSTNECTNAKILSPGQGCEMLIEFSPVNSGSLSESITVNETAANGATSIQSITLSGEAEELSTLTSPAPGATLAGNSVTFYWTSVPGATDYYLSLGTTGVGSSNIYNSGKRTTNSITATGIPAAGGTVYARLTTYFGSLTMYVDYTFTASTQAVLQSPVPSSVLAGPTETFTWTQGTGSSFSLWLGSTGVGSNNIYASAGTPASSMTVTNIPTNGETIYVRLLTTFGTVQTHTDYVLTAATQAVLVSPAAGVTLSGATATFTWTAGTEATNYTLWLGSTGVGSDNLYNSGQITGTSATVSGLPTNGKTIYARLFTTLNGVQVHLDTTYTAY